MTITLKPLADQVLVITGASSGIGLVTARMAAARGAAVFLIARGGDALAEAVRGIEAAGGRAGYAVADVGDLGQLEAAAAKAVEHFGRIDTWVSNAGVAIYAPLLDTPIDAHEQLFRTNYFGTVHSATVAVPHLRKQGGALIVIASIAAELPTPVMGAYAASKHAVKAYAEGLRIELHGADEPIALTVIQPSGIDTPIAKHALDTMDGAGRIPPPPYDPALVAEAILYCAAHVRREMTVGGVGRAQMLFGQLFPRVYEWIAPIAGRAFIDKNKAQPQPDNLFAPVRDGEERSGEQAALRSSVYTWTQRHPKTVGALGLGGLALGIAAMTYARREKAPTKRGASRGR